MTVTPLQVSPSLEKRGQEALCGGTPGTVTGQPSVSDESEILPAKGTIVCNFFLKGLT